MKAEGEFTCIFPGCGKCCTGQYAGAVFVTPSDIEQLAQLLSISVGNFYQEYIRRTEGELRLRMRPGGDCVFFDRATKRCSVFAARPEQCRTYPFWPEITRSKRAWNAEAKQCPGMAPCK